MLKNGFTLFVFVLFATLYIQPVFANETTPTPTPQTFEIKPGAPGVIIPLVTTTPDFSSYPLANIQIKIIKQGPTFESPGTRTVYLEWTPIEGTTKYNILVRQDGTSYSKTYAGTQTNNTSVIIKNSENYYVRVDACSGLNKCVSSPELFVPKLKEEFSSKDINRGESNQKKEKPTPEEIKNSTSTPDPYVDELNKKVTNLESKLAESEKKQNALEQTLNGLLSWIKSRFWFFK